MKLLSLCFLSLILSASTWADSTDDVDKKDAAIGGGIGGADGAVIGAEIGDRKGAIIGSAVGAAIGTAVATQPEDQGGHAASHPPVTLTPVVEISIHAGEHPKSKHCPPGQAKKGRC